MKKLELRARDPVSCYTHLAGALLSVVGTVILVLYCIFAKFRGTILTACIVFGLSLIALYTASAAYHYCKGGEKRILRLRKLDHAMIYVLIAGTYTPMIFAFINPPHSLILNGIMWAIALVGICINFCWFGAPRWLSTLLYILMGWAIVFFGRPVFTQMPKRGIILLVAGGISYTVGGLIYAFKWPNFFRRWFGFHELFHIFVLAGSVCHYLTVCLYAV